MGIRFKILAIFIGMSLLLPLLGAIAAKTDTIIIALLTLFALSLAIVLGGFLAKRITEPINRLKDATLRIAKGDLDVRTDIDSKDEVGDLSASFNAMAERLREFSGKLERKVEEKTIKLTTETAKHKKAEETIRHMAYHDPLTGLPNRQLLIDRAGQILARGPWRKRFDAILLLDIDRFKDVIDSFGHRAGDELLKNAAERLIKNLRSGDTVARHGGDEFTIFLQDMRSIEDIPMVAKKAFSAFARPFVIEDNEIFVTISMGISVYPNDGDDVETLLKNADIALYQAKEEGKNTFKFFTQGMNERVLKRLDLEWRLRKAVEKEELLLYYQPEVDLNTGNVIGLEALLRWHDPEKGIISPGEFIPVAEETGLILPIGEHVIRSACKQNRAWQKIGIKPVSVAVNISMRQFRQKDFVDIVARILKETGLSPNCLELELTESMIMEDAKSVIDMLNKLKAMGVRLTIDDFGTGYSSLEYLKKMPVDMLKVAQVFVRDIASDTDVAAIAATIINMGRTLNIGVIAEGVETLEQLNILRKIGCDKIQGFIVSKPLMPYHGVEAFLKDDWRFKSEP